MEVHMNRQRWQNWLIALLGLWVIVSPWAVPYFYPAEVATGMVMWNHIVVGLALAVMGVAALAAYQMWEEWVDVILGAWLVASPWILGFAGMTALMWNAVIMGAVVVVLSGWILYTGTSEMSTA
jgi:SPW repeat